MKKKLVLGVTAGGSSKLLVGQAKYFKEKGYEVFLISEDHYKEHLFCEKEGCTHLPVKITKEISPLKDLRSLFQVIKHFRKVKPDIVNVGTPKMGLLGIIAAYLLGVQNRIFTCRGLRYENTSGLSRFLLRSMEWLTNLLAKKIIFVGHSLQEAAQAGGTAFPKKSFVIDKGSSNGVNMLEFNPERFSNDEKFELRKSLGIKPNQLLIGYVGRVSKRKGCEELYHSFNSIHEEFPWVKLLMVGHMDCSSEFELKIRNHPGINYMGWSDEIPYLMTAMDIFVLPSWQEGFSNVCIQAAAMGLPVITTSATGCRDAVLTDFNGIVYPYGTVEPLKEAMLSYIRNPEKRLIHSLNSRSWASNFDQERIWEGIENVYLQ
ncbi:MAG: glycosyltransferase family 4 protein [Flavobacterium sp.]|nr:glycosyltransferase family 4 protein [Flavobacterium sp.]